jgi:hypothetical protein
MRAHWRGADVCAETETCGRMVWRGRRPATTRASETGHNTSETGHNTLETGHNAAWHGVDAAAKQSFGGRERAPAVMMRRGWARFSAEFKGPISVDFGGVWRYTIGCRAAAAVLRLACSE